MAYDPSIFNISPYYDDYDPDKKFLRMLFKPGYAVQARELTQLQTILQNQISKIGDHLFKDGSRIVGAPISVRNSSFLGMKTGTGTPFAGFGSTDWDSLVGGTVYYGATASGKIAHVLAPETDDKLFVVFDYVKGSGTSIPITGATVGITTATGAGYNPFVVAGASHNGICKLVTVGDGIFYVDGMFVVNQQQTFTPYSVSGSSYRNLSGVDGGVTFAAIDKKVGFSISRDTATSEEDLSLLDPSFGSPNYKAPGADRYVINLELAQTDSTQNADDFIELLRFEDGKVTKKVDRVVYGDISETLSRRTYDESGSYTVSPFDVSVRQSLTRENGLDVVVGPGKAYVFGNEVETKYPTIIGITKARTAETETSNFIFNTGNVLGVCLDKTNTGLTAYTYFNNMNGGSALVRFRNSSNAVIGEARVHGLVPRNSGITTAFFSMYLYGISNGSVISGASTAVVYGSPGGASSGITFGIFGPISGTTFGVVEGSGSNDTNLVYEIAPTQGISGFTNLSFYGKISTKSSASWATPISYNPTNTTTTYTVAQADIDLPTVPSSSYFDITPDLTTTETSSRSVIAKYNFANNSGLVFSPVSLNSSEPVTGVSVKEDTSSPARIVFVTQNTPSGFSGAAGTAVRMVLPFKYTPDLSTPTGVSASCRTKTPTTGTISSSAYTFRTINGRLGFTLPHWDVYSVSALTVGGTNVITKFELDDGQKEAFYDHSALVVKKANESEYSAGSSYTVSATYRYFRHGGTDFGPFVGYHSYLGLSYDQVPLFTNPKTGKTVSLANCVDFRHSGPTLDTIISKPYGDYESLSATSATWANYLPRIDRLSLKYNPSDASTYFDITSGTPELSPQSPPEAENSMTIATLVLPAYTQRAADVVINKSDTRRYTMEDIQNVQKRVDNIESFAKLSLSESEMVSKAIKPLLDSYILNGGTTTALGISSVPSSEPVKTSVYSDDFYGHAGSDVSDPDHRCSVDYQYGELRSLFTHKQLELGTLTLSGTTVSADGLATLNYSSTDLVDNSGYNKSIAVNPTGTVNWLGFMKFTKQYETDFDASVRPVVYNNNMLENDNWIGSNANNARGFGTQWNDWEYLWSGIQIRTDEKDDIQKRILETPRTNSGSSIPNVNSGNEKTGLNRNLPSPDLKLGNLVNSNRLVGRTTVKTQDNRIIDRTVVPYIPANTIGVTAYGLRPNSSGLNLYVDGVLVKSGLTTNSNGTVGVTFAFTSEAYLSGEKSVRIADNADPQNTTQAVDGMFYCGASIKQRFDGVYSTRNPEYRRQTVTSEGVIKDPFNRDVSYDNIQDTVGNNQWVDPLCQTFIVDKKLHPEGLFVNSVTLYFAEKDDTLPVTVQLRPTVNGYPSPSVSFPFSTVTLMPSEVSTGFVGGTVTPVGTGFTFSSPVYLEPGEYAIAVMTNSSNYTLRAYDSGVDLVTGGRGGSNPLVGTLYEPQSVGAAAQNLSSDIAFKVSRCEFSTSSGTVQSSNLDVNDCQIIKTYTPQIIPLECTATTVLDPSSTLVGIENNQNKYLSSVYTSDVPLRYTLTRTSKGYISPAIDTGVFFGLGAVMVVTNNINTTSSYVSKVVTLPEELISTGVFALADVCCPSGSEVKAYVRWLDRGESDLFAKSWTQMVAVGGLGSPEYPFTASANLSKTEYDFRPTQWAWFNASSTVRAYQIKLVYTTTLTGAQETYSSLPCVRNLRMSSFRTV